MQLKVVSWKSRSRKCRRWRSGLNTEEVISITW